MGLREYHRKRDFSKTPEPRGATPDPRERADRSFVIQKHAATRLHYDFRLELEGVLKSWAVPKGPSLDPADKRLAMHVEDHPLEYGGFEGVIPKGEYGGGTVMLWDQGTWEPIGDPHRDYHAGSLKFRLHGKKLHGAWALVKIKSKDGSDKPWLLIKEKDAEVRAGGPGVVETEPNSVTTGRSMDEIAAARDRVWHSDRDRAGEEKPPAAPEPVPAARRAALPRTVSPQLATLVAEAPGGDAWLHEMKFDGYRILARADAKGVQLLSRNGKDWTDHFPTVAKAVRGLPLTQALLDGEVAVLQPDGTTSFQALQNFMADGSGAGQLVYLIFDLLHLDGLDLTAATLEARKARLEALLRGAGGGELRYSEHVVGRGADVFAEACRLGLEGIISKERTAPYRAGRGRSWVKVKCVKRQEVVVGGYTDPEGARTGLGALLVGVHEDGRLVYAGKVGTGFSDRSLRDLTRRLRALAQERSPFATPVEGASRAHWVRPELVAEVAFTEWTGDGRMRHPSFQGLREDKAPRDVVRERPAPAAPARDDGAAPDADPPARGTTAKGRGARARPPRAPARGAAPRARSTARAARPATAPPASPGRGVRGSADVAGVRITHADRVVYPERELTKLDVARYYESIAEWILPHLRDRPTSLVRCPEGLAGECFYQKHTGTWAPPALRRVKIRERTKVGEYLVVDSLEGLIGLAQIGILEIHTWGSLASRLEQPDRLVFDLDPDPAVPWARTVEAARLVRARLDGLGLESFVKTTGGKGLHVVAPLVPGADWDAVHAFSQRVAADMVREDPRGFVDEMSKAARAGKIFIDYLRNARGATAVAAYSTRAKAPAPVSVPLAWDELSARTRSDAFTVETVRRRLTGLRADPWARYWTRRQSLPGTPGAEAGRPRRARRR